jgi:hypothetical protein
MWHFLFTFPSISSSVLRGDKAFTNKFPFSVKDSNLFSVDMSRYDVESATDHPIDVVCKENNNISH